MRPAGVILLAAIAAAAALPTAAVADPATPPRGQERNSPYMRVFGVTQAPYGFVQFCSRMPAECQHLAQRHPTDTRVQRYTKGRSEQLLVWSDLQKRRSELSAFRNKTKLTAAEADAVHKALESSAAYIAVGRVAASTIYDGERLPKLLRLQDAANGRTIAYLKPDSKYEVVNLIGNLVGIVGEKTYDEVLHLNIVHPRRIDLLTPEQHNAAMTTEH